MACVVLQRVWLARLHRKFLPACDPRHLRLLLYFCAYQSRTNTSALDCRVGPCDVQAILAK